jgi:hypothetical protein
MQDIPAWGDDDHVTWSDRGETSLRQYEDQAVAAVFNHFKAPARLARLRQDKARATGGRPQVTFRELQDEFPDFPLCCGVVSVPHVTQNLTIVNWFKRVTKLPVFEAWKQLSVECREQGRPGTPVLIFQFPKLAKFCTLHTVPRDVATSSFCVRYVDNQPVALEPLAALLETTDWSP